AFAGRVPGGSNAVGLVVPLFASVLAAALLLLASGLSLAGHRLDWVGARAGAWVIGLALGVGVAAVAVLLAWMGQFGRWVAPAGIFLGGLAPLLAGALLLLSWWAPERLAAAGWPRLAGGLLGLSAVLGAVIVMLLLADWWRLQQENAARVAVSQLQEDNERTRRQELTPLEQLREDYASYAPDTPLWVFVAGLPEIDDPAERAFVITRALKVPNFNSDLQRTISDRHPRYRHGAIELLLHIDAGKLDPKWAPMLAQSISVSAQEIAQNAEWLTPNAMSNPNPERHIQAMIAAADRLGPSSQLSEAIVKLRRALSTLPGDSKP
ncbi:MAG TPA: hypothetical protein VN259_03255, partial [Xanthomonadales bacterium]|nr:hypothetical protein [Xanthomonadales bacterium]